MNINKTLLNFVILRLYEEEILNSNTALWFSPNGDHIAYLQINSTLVDFQCWNKYGEYYNISSNQYPVMESIRYAKPGTRNPEGIFLQLQCRCWHFGQL